MQRMGSWVFWCAMGLLGGCTSDGGEPAPGAGGGIAGACPTGTSACAGSCVDLTSNVAHCGACGVACGALSECVSGACACSEEFLRCGGVCVDPQSDPVHCGACGTRCEAGEYCYLGVCSGSCGALTECSGACVDLAANAAHCGSCGTQCGGGSECSMGTCVCPPGQESCDGVCVVEGSCIPRGIGGAGGTSRGTGGREGAGGSGGITGGTGGSGGNGTGGQTGGSGGTTGGGTGGTGGQTGGSGGTTGGGTGGTGGQTGGSGGTTGGGTGGRAGGSGGTTGGSGGTGGTGGTGGKAGGSGGSATGGLGGNGPTINFRPSQKPRLIITTDIGGDPDDRQSMVRLLSYANEFDLEGLIASAAGTIGELDEAIVRPDLIDAAVTAYGQVRPNLLQHASGFPQAAELRAVIKSGNPNRGTNHIGSGKDTAASNWIIAVVDDASDPRPVNLSIWGGQTDLAQALWTVKNTRSTSAYDAFVRKLRVYDTNDQDGLFGYLSTTFPGLFYVLGKADPKCTAAYRGMFYQGDTSLLTKTWIDRNVKVGHGALGALYPEDGLWTCGNGVDGVKEGDTPSWFYFLDNGLQSPANPEWGGWGARYAPGGFAYRDAQDTVSGVTSRTATVYRWRTAYQNDFEARLDWQRTASFTGANHPPIAVLAGDSTRRIATLTVRAGSSFTLSAAGSSDPDGGKVSYAWWLYREPSTTTAVSLANANTAEVEVTVGSGAAGKRAHVILEVLDSGAPQLRAYRRLVVEVQ